MNDTGGGVTAIHDVPGDITRIGFHWMLFFPFCHSKGVLLFCLHTECLGDHGGSSCYEFANFVFTRRIAEITDFLCPEFSNFRIFSSHGMSRRSRIFFVPRLVLGSTDRREVIRDFFSSHGLSRNNLFYHELSNYRISFTRNVAEITDFLCPETCPWTH